MAGENTKKQTFAAFGEAMRRHRAALGMTQAELASRVGVSASLIALFESGKRQPRLDRILALLEALGATRAESNALLTRVGLTLPEVRAFPTAAQLESQQRQLETRRRQFQEFLFSTLEMTVTALSRDTTLLPAERRLLQSISQKIQQLKRVNHLRSLRP